MDSSVTSSTKRRGLKKRVVEIPIRDVEMTRVKAESSNNTPPPSDSWAWRKYGQKPIKGSPYPRGYYRCSSSKSCPARKQVERSSVDPTMLLVTYSSDHNHPSPRPRNNRNSNAAVKSNKESEPEERFADLGEDSLITTADELGGGWLGEVEAIASSPAVLDGPIFAELEMSMLGEEEESLFADLGELPECSAVFRRGVLLESGRRRRSAGGVSVGPLVEANHCSL